ncbi:HAD family hydrolase [Humibacter ginsengisoli]
MTDTADATLGLTSAEVAERVAAGRTNAYTDATSRSAWSIVRANVFTLFNGIIVACFAVLLILGRWQDALFGLSAIANTIIGSVQEFRAKAALDKLALLHAPTARVIRDGELREVTLAEVVLDDILVLRAGDQIAADGAVVDSSRLQADESMLTGESDAVDKQPGGEDGTGEVLSGSIVVGGEGTVRVTRVGADSFANKLASEAKRFSLVASELRRSVDKVLKFQAWIIGPVALLVLNAQIFVFGGWPEAIRSGDWRQAAVNAIASVIAMIPLGLVLMTSIAFAVGAVKLAARQVLVQELPAVEGLARVDVICLDKTGTLTEGEIVFDQAHPVSRSVSGPLSAVEAQAVPDAGFMPRGWEQVLAWYGAEPDANATARCLAAVYPTEGDLEPDARIPFSSARKWSAVSFTGSAEGTWVLGGPEMVFQGAAHEELRGRSAELAASGRRTLVLGHCAATLTPEHVDAETLPAGLKPVTLLTFRESVRSDALETLGYFASQGVAVKIISGDNPQTVAAIAREVGLDAPSGFDARELPDDQDALAAELERHTVFGRVTPTQKKGIVQALQAAGHTVAMTGDGVNDALAIKEADIGIAMESGSAATKAVARIVLLDGKFEHLPGVVAEGRQVIANIERVSMLFLTKTAWATVLAIVFGISIMQFPFLPRQLSVVDGLTIGIPAFFLALMPNTRRYIPGFLRRSLSFAVPAGLVVGLVVWWYAWAAGGAGIQQDELRTGSTLILTIIGLWILVVLSRPIDGWKIVIIGAMMIGLIVVYAVPLARTFLGFADPSLITTLLVIGLSIVAIAGVEVVRFIHRRYVRRHGGSGDY